VVQGKTDGNGDEGRKETLKVMAAEQKQIADTEKGVATAYGKHVREK
jgi:hypothetical protein